MFWTFKSYEVIDVSGISVSGTETVQKRVSSVVDQDEVKFVKTWSDITYTWGCSDNKQHKQNSWRVFGEQLLYKNNKTKFGG